ncbi:hypothetical protein FB567DRAFT_61545 [Paraphoma chrysanthemicola]|uniref:DUF7730 domain-containing protein n=1 Tax=Paraphoma chrysanthemicola TaxID=798071 RepID=A0A8K0R515_9PLEO|nr:hypothetical protein FB567DRAFT_61545 [Paraphoma chrysanthemicola]
MQSSPLLRLPGEIRTQIFANVLGGYDVQFGRNPKARDTDRPTSARQGHHKVLEFRRSGHDDLATETFRASLALISVCRQIYAEAAMVPFTCNTWVLYPETSEKSLAQRLLPAQQNAIRTVRCSVAALFWEYERGTVASRYCDGTFNHLEGLERLVLEVGNRVLTEEEKECLLMKVKKANDREGLKVVWAD